MNKSMALTDIMSQLRQTFSSFPDVRLPSNNTKYSLQDAGISAFSVFFMQCSSFLEYQQRMRDSQGHDNAETLFGVHQIPCDNQIRSLLDKVPPSSVFPAYHYLFDWLTQKELLKEWQYESYGYLLALDGTQQFSSSRIHCEHCLTKQYRSGKISYSHQVITPIITSPNQSEDGQKKQDCEVNASKRWLNKWASRYFPLDVTVLGDDLYCHEPFCREIIDLGGNFIFTCKPSSHKTLYEWLEGLETTHGITVYKVRRWTGRHHVIDTYRFAKDVPLRNADDALLVNWCELTSIREDGQQLYQNAFATSNPVIPTIYFQ